MSRQVDSRFGCISKTTGKIVIYREPTHKPVVSHTSDGHCVMCGIPAQRHKKPKPRKARTQEQEREKSRAKRAIARAQRMELPIVGIDGEGEGRKPHIYTYLSAVNENGEKLGSLFAIHGLKSIDILNWIVDLPTDTVYGFSLGYDFAMWLRDLPAEIIFNVVRPELNQSEPDEKGRTRALPQWWRCPETNVRFRFRYLRRRLEIARMVFDKTLRKWVVQAKIVVWDVFAFYQASFVKALKNWKVGSQEEIDFIARMKERRHEFELVSAQEQHRYCDRECELLGKLVRKLINSHEEADLPLRAFYGAGSTSSALLKRMGINQYRMPYPGEMKRACMQGFFGGRFELSRVGPVPEACWGHDISSAYPYAMCFLPCLAHGTWRHEKGAHIQKYIHRATLALVNCEVRRSGPKTWGALPFRDAKGNITFPISAESTWVWREEYIAAIEGLWPGVTAKEAWIYETDCECQPFRDLPDTYMHRLKLGAEGAGMVLKLGMNGGYGKLAQSQGFAPFQSFIWAGVITSNCRAQLLGAISAARNPESVLMLATDGVLAREKLDLPLPRETGTGDEYFDPDKKKMRKKPLGGWDIEEYPNGVMLCRPGIYFPLDVNERKDSKPVKSRGISARVLHAHADRILEHFQKLRPWHLNSAKDRGVYAPVCTCTNEDGSKAETCKPDMHLEHGVCTRFVGLKQGVGIGKKGKIVKRDNFCDWEDWPITVTFDATPKRERVRNDFTLVPWFRKNGESEPYKKGMEGSEGEIMRGLTEILEEQPTGDLSL